MRASTLDKLNQKCDTLIGYDSHLVRINDGEYHLQYPVGNVRLVATLSATLGCKYQWRITAYSGRLTKQQKLGLQDHPEQLLRIQTNITHIIDYWPIDC